MTASPRVYDAPIESNAPIPAYKVVEVEGPFEKEVSHFDEKSKTIVKNKVQIYKGYMVFFPRGHSVFYDSLEALEANGFGEVVPLIRMNYDAEVNKDHQPTTVRRKFGKATDEE